VKEKEPKRERFIERVKKKMKITPVDTPPEQEVTQ